MTVTNSTDAARAAAARAAQQRAAQEAARAAAQKAAQDAAKTTADPATADAKQPALSPTQVQATADVQQARGEKAATTIGAVDAKKPATTTTTSSSSSTTNPLYAAEPAPLSTSTSLTETTQKALAPEASVDDRKKAAEQFTEGWSIGGMFTGRDTTVSGDDVKNAQTLHQAEALRSDANPEVKAKLESEMLKGLEQAQQGSSVEDRERAKSLATDLAWNPNYSADTRQQAFSSWAKTEGLVDDKGVPKRDQVERYAERARTLLDETRGGGHEYRLRNEVARGIYNAANSATGDKRTALTRLGDDVTSNKPQDAGERAVVEGLANGTIDPTLLPKNEADRALALMERYPPRSSLMTNGRPDASADTLNAARDEGLKRMEATEALKKRTSELGALYDKNGWSKDTDLRPGNPPDAANPAADQATLLDITQRAQAATTEGKPLDASSFSTISPVDTSKGLKAIDNLKAQNPDVFGDKVPTDPQALQTRESVLSIEQSLRRHSAVQNLTLQVDGLEKGFDKALEARGVVGHFADFTKNTFNSDVGSDAVARSVKNVADQRQQLEALRDFKGTDAEFDAALREKAGALETSLKEAGEHIGRFQDSQHQWVDTVSDITAATAAVAAVAAAPVTGGASLLVGGAVGAATKVSTKALEAVTGDGTYQGNLLGDIALGGLGGGSATAAMQLSKLAGAKIASSLASRPLAATAGFLGGEALGGAVDGGVVGTASSLLRGDDLATAANNGVKTAALGAVLGPLVGGTLRGGSALVKAVREGATPPSRLPFSDAGDVVTAQLQHAGINTSVLGDVATKALPENATPFARLKPDGSVEVGLPVRADGTISRATLAHEAEHLKQIAAAKQTGDPAITEHLASAQRQAAEVQRLETAVSTSTDAATRTRLSAELDKARAAYANNPLEVQARMAGLNAEADALQATRPDRAARIREKAQELSTQTALPTSTTTSSSTTALTPGTLHANPTTEQAALAEMMREDIAKFADDLANFTTPQGQSLTRQREEIDALVMKPDATPDGKLIEGKPQSRLTMLMQDAKEYGVSMAEELRTRVPAPTAPLTGRVKTVYDGVESALAAKPKDASFSVKTREEAEQIRAQLMSSRPIIDVDGNNARFGRGFEDAGLSTTHWDTAVTTNDRYTANKVLEGHEQVWDSAQKAAAEGNHDLAASHRRHATLPHLQMSIDGVDVRIFIEP